MIVRSKSGCTPDSIRLPSVLLRKTPLMIMSSKVHARKAPNTNVFGIACEPTRSEVMEPTSAATIHMMVATTSSPMTRLAEDAVLWSTAWIALVIISVERNAETKSTGINSKENCFVRASKPVRQTVESARRNEATVSDGRRKRFLYLLASCPVDDPYS